MVVTYIHLSGSLFSPVNTRVTIAQNYLLTPKNKKAQTIQLVQIIKNPFLLGYQSITYQSNKNTRNHKHHSGPKEEMGAGSLTLDLGVASMSKS